MLRRHAQLMNPRHVRVLLFTPRRDNVAAMVTEALRRLAFLAGGTGGRGTGAPTMWAPTWYGGGGRRTLAWTAQTCCGAVDFMAPWRVVRWQPDSLSFLPTSVREGRFGGGEEANDAATTLRALHELAGAAPEEAVPDGAVPAALPRFLRLVGMAEAEMALGGCAARDGGRRPEDGAWWLG